MNHTTTPTTVKRRTGPLLIGAALVGVLALAGCTPDAASPTPSPTTTSATPTPTPTPTEAGVPAPQTEDEAVDAGTTAVNDYLRTRGEVNAAGGADVTPLEAIATGTALTVAQEDAQRIVTDQKTTTGALKFEFQTGYATDLVATDGTTYPFASATITGCQDASEYAITLADGTAAQRPESLRSVLEFTTLWEPNLKTWLVQTVTATGSTC